MPKPKEIPEFTRVRVLSDCEFGLWGEVADIPRYLVASAKAACKVDDHPDAVAYAEQQLAARKP